MRAYINELSLQGQFGSEDHFIASLREILRARASSLNLRQGLYCSRTALRDRPVFAGVSVADSLYRTADRQVRILALGWFDKFGPFMEDDRMAARGDDFFQCLGQDVTDLGLGEIARRLIRNEVAVSFSFSGGLLDFNVPRLEVLQGLEEEVIASVDVRNFSQIEELRTELDQAVPRPGSWQQLLATCRARFNCLSIGQEVDATLARETFRVTLRDGITDLLSVLHEFMENRAADGTVTERGEEILETYFRRANAWFSDESDTNKRLFRAAMTFRDPESPGDWITCFWHGKIQTPQFRVHFEWPVPVGQEHLKVVYIGPKISKR